MSKTFKLSGIFLISVINLQIFRIIFNFIQLPDNIAGWMFSFLFQGLNMGLIPYLLYRFWVAKDNKSFLKDFKLSQKINPYSYLLAIGIGFLVLFINIGASSVWYLILKMLGYTYPSSVGTIYSSPEVLIFELLATAVMPAIFEELVDRGLLLSILDREKNDKKVVLIVGIFFGFLHQNIAQLGPTAFGGIVMAYMAVKCRNIVPGMIVHFINNAMLTVLSYSMQKGNALGKLYEGFYGLISSHFLLVMAIWAGAIWLLVAALRLFERLNRKHREQSDPLYVPPVAPQRPAAVTQPTAAFNEDYFFKIYGSPRAAQDAATAIIPPAPVQATIASAKDNIKKWEYGLLYCAFFSSLIATVFSFIWGLLR